MFNRASSRALCSSTEGDARASQVVDATDESDDVSDHSDDEAVAVEAMLDRLSVRTIVAGWHVGVAGLEAALAVGGLIRPLALANLRRLGGLRAGRALGTMSTW